MVGTRFPLASTAVGLVLLAHAPTDVRDAVLAGPLERHTSHTVTDARRLRAILAQIRRNQYAVSDRALQENTVGVAAPIRSGPTGEVHAALGIVVAGATAAAVRPLRPRVVAAARGITSALGQRPGAADGRVTSAR